MNIDELGTKVSQLKAQVVYHGNEQQRIEELTEKIEKEFGELREQCAAPKEAEKYRAALRHILREVAYINTTRDMDHVSAIRQIAQYALKGEGGDHDA